MPHPLENSLIVSPEFIISVVKADKNIITEITKNSGLSLNTVKTHLGRQKFSATKSTVKFLKAISSIFKNMFGTEGEMFFHLEKGDLHHHLRNKIIDLIRKKQIVPDSPWETFFNTPTYGFFLGIDFPKTKQLTLHFDHLKKNIIWGFDRDQFFYSALYLSFAEKPSLIFDKKLIEKCEKSKTKEEFIRYSLQPFLQCYLYAIAIFNVEFYPLKSKLPLMNEEQRRQSEQLRQPWFDMFIPAFDAKGKFKPPIKQWWDYILKTYNLKNGVSHSWDGILNSNILSNEKLPEEEPDDELSDLDISLLRKWEKGKHTPKYEKINLILSRLFQKEQEEPQILELIFYVVAKIFQHIYEKLYASGLNEKDIIAFFDNYSIYYKAHFEEYKKAAV